MIFQMVDDKSECIGVYLNGKIHFDDYPYIYKNSANFLNSTWKYSETLKDKEVEYGFLYANGKDLDQVCPEYLKPKWKKIVNKFKAYLKSFKTAKININEHCLYDIMPIKFLTEFCSIKSEIVAYVISNYPKPKDYDFLVGIHKLIYDINQQKLNLNFDNISQKLQNHTSVKALKKTRPFISYEQFGMETRGLRGKKGYFPIMNIKRELRSVLMPNNDVLVEIDYNSAHLRVLLGLCEYEQPKIDIHQWNNEKFFNSSLSRDQLKKQTFAWLYNENAISPLNSIYNRKKVLDKYFNGATITNVYGREIECDKHHALNYIIASNANEMFLRQVLKVNELLKDKKSKIIATIQDSILFDFDKTERYLISKIGQIFSQTIFGDFKFNLRIGKNFGEMKKIDEQV